MLRVLWALKRAHWCSWAGARRALRACTILPKRTRRVLTPARLDVLHLLELHGSMSQKAMRAALGVVKSTLSEMLSTMERLGLVSRGRRTRRGRTVSPTDEGHEVWLDAFTIEEELDWDVANAFGSDACELVFENGCHALRAAFGEVMPRLLYDFLPVFDE